MIKKFLDEAVRNDNNSFITLLQKTGSLAILTTLSHSMPDPDTSADNRLRKSEELRSFLFLTAVMVPVLTVLFIAAYGFVVWFYQILIGGPPH